MKLFYHHCSPGFSNCYILGTETSDAIIIDPGNMDINILKTIESNNFNLRGVFITHGHKSHVRGLATLKRIYDVEVFAINQAIQEHKTTMVKDGNKINIGGINIEVISVPGHSSDSVVYLTGMMLFTGDALTAGFVGTTSSSYGAATQMKKLRGRVLSLPGDYIVLPGHGPPSTLEAERCFNHDIINFDINRNRKPVFRVSS